MLRILESWIVLRPCTICHKFRLCTGFARVAPRGRPYSASATPRIRAGCRLWQPLQAVGDTPHFLLLITAFCGLLLFFSALISQSIACMRLRRSERYVPQGLPRHHCQFEFKGATAPSESETCANRSGKMLPGCSRCRTPFTLLLFSAFLCSLLPLSALTTNFVHGRNTILSLKARQRHLNPRRSDTSASPFCK